MLDVRKDIHYYKSFVKSQTGGKLATPICFYAQFGEDDFRAINNISFDCSEHLFYDEESARKYCEKCNKL